MYTWWLQQAWNFKLYTRVFHHSLVTKRSINWALCWSLVTQFIVYMVYIYICIYIYIYIYIYICIHIYLYSSIYLYNIWLKYDLQKRSDWQLITWERGVPLFTKIHEITVNHIFAIEIFINVSNLIF